MITCLNNLERYHRVYKRNTLLSPPLARTLFLALSSVRLIPHILVFLLHSGDTLLISDLKKWVEEDYSFTTNKWAMAVQFLTFMTFYPEYRNQFYFRTGYVYRFFLSFLCKPMPSLYIKTKNIGEGFFVQHGFSTILAAEEIGTNFRINQQVTIGYTDKYDCPIIGDNVTVCAGAKVLGRVKVGNNVVIGANAVVVKDVPDNCTVVGVPARIVKLNGERCSLAL